MWSNKRAINFCGHWNQFPGLWVQCTYEYVSFNSLSISLKHGKIVKFETNSRSSFRFNVWNWKQLARWTLDENCIFVRITSLTCWKLDVHNKTAPTLLVTLTVQTVQQALGITVPTRWSVRQNKTRRSVCTCTSDTRGVTNGMSRC